MRKYSFFQIILGFVFSVLFVSICAQVPIDKQQMAMEYFRNREYSKALPLFEELHQQNPSQTTYYYYTTCLLETKDFRKAERAVKQQIKADPTTNRYQVDLGFVYISSGDLVKGKKEYEDVIRTLPADRHLINEAANAFLIRREDDYTIRVYERGKALLANSYQFHMELGDLYERTGKFEASIREYLSLLETDAASMNFIQARLQNSLLNDPDNIKSDLLRAAILRRIRQSPDVLVYSEMMLWFSIQRQDFEGALNQAMALDRRLNESGNRVYSIAQLSIASQQFETAIKAYKYLIDKGEGGQFYLSSRVEILNTEYQLLKKRPTASRDEYKALENNYKATLNELGRSRLTIQLIRNLANLYAFVMFDSERAIALLTETLSMPGINQRDQAECKLELADIFLYSGEVWESTLLFSQIEKAFPNEPIGHEAKFRNARLSYFIGEFAWARAQLDVLKAATSKLIANDALALSLLIKDNMDQDSTYTALAYYSRAELNSFRNRNDLALMTLDSILSIFPYHSIHDDVLMKKAEILFSQSRFTDAVALLQKIIDNFAFDLLADKAMFRLGETYQYYLNDRDKAMHFYKELMLQFPGSLYVAPARERFRVLRGDAV